MMTKKNILFIVIAILSNTKTALAYVSAGLFNTQVNRIRNMLNDPSTMNLKQIQDDLAALKKELQDESPQSARVSTYNDLQSEFDEYMAYRTISKKQATPASIMPPVVAKPLPSVKPTVITPKKKSTPLSGLQVTILKPDGTKTWLTGKTPDLTIASLKEAMPRPLATNEYLTHKGIAVQDDQKLSEFIQGDNTEIIFAIKQKIIAPALTPSSSPATAKPVIKPSPENTPTPAQDVITSKNAPENLPVDSANLGRFLRDNAATITTESNNRMKILFSDNMAVEYEKSISNQWVKIQQVASRTPEKPAITPPTSAVPVQKEVKDQTELRMGLIPLERNVKKSLDAYYKVTAKEPYNLKEFAHVLEDVEKEIKTYIDYATQLKQYNITFTDQSERYTNILKEARDEYTKARRQEAFENAAKKIAQGPTVDAQEKEANQPSDIDQPQQPMQPINPATSVGLSAKEYSASDIPAHEIGIAPTNSQQPPQSVSAIPASTPTIIPAAANQAEEMGIITRASQTHIIPKQDVSNISSIAPSIIQNFKNLTQNPGSQPTIDLLAKSLRELQNLGYRMTLVKVSSLPKQLDATQKLLTENLLVAGANNELAVTSKENSLARIKSAPTISSPLGQKGDFAVVFTKDPVAAQKQTGVIILDPTAKDPAKASSTITVQSSAKEKEKRDPLESELQEQYNLFREINTHENSVNNAIKKLETQRRNTGTIQKDDFEKLQFAIGDYFQAVLNAKSKKYRVDFIDHSQEFLKKQTEFENLPKK